MEGEERELKCSGPSQKQFFKKIKLKNKAEK